MNYSNVYTILEQILTYWDSAIFINNDILCVIIYLVCYFQFGIAFCMTTYCYTHGLLKTLWTTPDGISMKQKLSQSLNQR